MRYLVILAILFAVNNVCSNGESFRQEAARVVSKNPKYVKDVSVFTYRHTRQSPYLTSGNCTILHLWNNNVSVGLEGYSAKFKTEIFSLRFKLCDILTVPWAEAWLKEYTNVPNVCPVTEGVYYFKEIELPPRNFPIPFPAGDYILHLKYFITASKENIVDFKVYLRFENKKRG